MKNKLPFIGWMENRNGTPDISEVEVCASIRSGCIKIGAKNCSGVSLKGGITAPVDAFMLAIKPYAERCGWIITNKEVM